MPLVVRLWFTVVCLYTAVRLETLSTAVRLETLSFGVMLCAEVPLNLLLLKGCDLAGLTLAELQAFSILIGADVFAVLTLEGSLASRNHLGGTAPEQVRKAIARARQS